MALQKVAIAVDEKGCWDEEKWRRKCWVKITKEIKEREQKEAREREGMQIWRKQQYNSE